MTDPVVQQFARHLATLDDSARARAIAQAKLLGMEAAPEEAFEPPIRTLGKYLDDPILTPPELVTPFHVVVGGITCTVGRAGKGKTVFGLNRILKWSVGRPVFDGWVNADGHTYFTPARPLKVLIIENEGAGGLFHRTMGIMLNADGFLDERERKVAKENVLIWGDGGYSGLKLDDPNKLDEVRRGCEQHEPDIVFVEPFRGLWNGEENSSTDMAIVVDNLVEMAADYKCGIMLSHHERKSGPGEDGEKMSAGRGSTVLEGVVVVMENFEAIQNGKLRELSVSKSRYASDPPPPGPCRMEWVPQAWWYTHVSDGMLGDAILREIRNSDEPLNVAALSELTDEKRNTLNDVLKDLVNDGKVERMASRNDGNGSTGFRYRLKSGGSTGTGGLAI